MGYIRIVIVRPVTLDEVISDAMEEFDEIVFLGECISTIGVPASVEDFEKGVRADKVLPDELKDLVIEEIRHFHPMGWWFVAKNSSSPLAGSLVRVIKLDGETATVAAISAHDADTEQNPTVSVSELSGTWPE